MLVLCVCARIIGPVYLYNLWYFVYIVVNWNTLYRHYSTEGAEKRSAEPRNRGILSISIYAFGNELPKLIAFGNEFLKFKLPSTGYPVPVYTARKAQGHSFQKFKSSTEYCRGQIENLEHRSPCPHIPHQYRVYSTQVPGNSGFQCPTGIRVPLTYCTVY